MMTVPYAIRHKLSLRPRTSTVCLCAQAAADTQERGFFCVCGDERLDERPPLLPRHVSGSHSDLALSSRGSGL